MKNIFDPQVKEELVRRINKIEANALPRWGKMNAGQMLAHCNVAYEMTYDNKHKRPHVLMRFILRAFIKKQVVNEIPYKKNAQTAPQFLVKEARNFDIEKRRLIAYLNKTQSLGSNHFEGKESLSFGPMTKMEWNNMFYKHLDHHLQQFGV